jgi:hypothetical protein
MLKLDSRRFSQEAYAALTELKTELDSSYHEKASGLIQGLTAYISTWGLHRLSGDAAKFLQGKGEDTKYKGKVYRKFLEKLSAFNAKKINIEEPGSLIKMPLREYTALNHLAIELAREWSFWASAILGEADDV